MSAIFGNMMQWLSGLSATGVFSQAPGDSVAQGPACSTFIYDEFASGGGGGGAYEASNDQRNASTYVPTRAQEVRCGIAIMLRGLSGAYEDLIGLNDPTFQVSFSPRPPARGRRSGGPPPASPTPRGAPPKTNGGPRTEGVAAAREAPDWSRVASALQKELQLAISELEKERTRAEHYRQRAEEYAPAALELRKLRGQLRRLEDLKRRSSEENGILRNENATLRRVCAEADEALEKAREALVSANARAEENAELARQAIDLEAQVGVLQESVEAAQEEARELREMVEVYRQFEKVADMEQRLRVRAQKQADEYLRVIESFEAGIGQLRQAVFSLRRRFADASVRVETRDKVHTGQLNQEVGELKEQLAIKRSEIEALTVEIKTLRGEVEQAKASERTAREEASRHRTTAEAANAREKENDRLLQEIDRLRGLLKTAQDEVTNTKASERTAREETSRYRAAAEAATAREKENGQLSEEIGRLRELLKGAQDAKTQAKDEALRLRRAAERAVAEAKEHREAAEREKARADRNERLSAEASRLRERVRELERAVDVEAATRRHIRDVLGSIGASARPRKSDRVRMIRPELAEAFETFGLDASASYEQYKTAFRSFVEVYHPDRFQKSSDAARAMAEEKMRKVNEAQRILEDHFRQQRSAATTRNCA